MRFADAFRCTKIDVNGSLVVRPIVRSTHDQVLNAFGIGCSYAIKIDVACASNRQSEPSFVILAVKGVKFLE